MSDKTQLGSRIATEAKAMLAEMATEDLRTMSTQLEVLIRQEYARRNAPHHKLVDTPVEYVTEKEKPMDRTAQVNELRELAENVATLGHGTAEELVEYALSNAGRESWGIDIELDAHDRNLLTRFVAEALMR